MNAGRPDVAVPEEPMSADVEAETDDRPRTASEATRAENVTPAGGETDPDTDTHGDVPPKRARTTAVDPVAFDSVEKRALDGLFERVLVVTDGQATGRAAVDAGVDLAAAHGATVDALDVVDTTEHWDVVVERRERTGEAAVEEAAARGERAGVDVEKWFRYGTAHEEALDFAAVHGVDLIVVGSARRTGLDRLVNPETLPVRLQRGADVPVLVVGADGD